MIDTVKYPSSIKVDNYGKSVVIGFRNAISNKRAYQIIKSISNGIEFKGCLDPNDVVNVSLGMLGYYPVMDYDILVGENIAEFEIRLH